MVQDFYTLYFWNHRAKAFDLYRVANSQRLRLNRMLATEEKHFKMTEKLMVKLEKYFDELNLSGSDEEGVLDLPPDKAVAMLEKLVGIQRISIGLPKSGESKEHNNVRRLEQPQQLIAQAIGDGGREQDAVDEEFEDLLDDPDAIAMAQDLILKRQEKGHM
jgi:hypothetical protein